MKYKRFLTLNDYLGRINRDHLSQISNGFDEDKFIKAEENSEDCVLEHLIENYKIEEVLAIGKDIMDHNKLITYPENVHFQFEGEIIKSMVSIQGVVVPEPNPYWIEDIDVPYEEVDLYLPYSQLLEFFPEDKTVIDDKYYTCLIKNGYEFNDIRIPGIANGWTKLDPGTLTQEEIDSMLEFDYDKNDYVSGNMVSFNDEYYRADGVVNFENPEKGINVKSNDPRNKNLRKHMVSLSLYELFKSISPNNISNIVVSDWEHSMNWLEKCNKMSINPLIDRRIDDNGKVSTDWAIATFSGSTYGNDWMV